ncbi:hypothetical protein ACTTAI_07825 [Rhodobacter capsulatus]|uniref:hypothetical protein n=1 Tax=Rhodobacter capsulatus TaxID=1061 RepID=UPI004024B906
MIDSVVDAAKASLVADLFAVPAIEDYVVARWAYLNGLKRQYYWSAAQALEKLLKASLISANVGVRNDKHHIAKMSTKLEALGQGLRSQSPSQRLSHTNLSGNTI